MTLGLIALGWAISLSLLMPVAIRGFRAFHLRLERLLLLRLEAFHIFVSSSVVRWIFMGCLGLAIAMAIVILGAFWLLPFILAALLVAVFGLLRWRLARRFKQVRYQLPGVIELLGTSLRAGLSIRSALLQVSRQAAPPVSQELAVIERMQRIGIPLETALVEWAKRLPIEEVRLMGFTISVSAASGGNLADSLDRLAGALRQRLILEEKVDALTAQGRLQAWVMVVLPILLALALTWIDPASMAPLWSSQAGHMILLVVALLEIGGLLWIRRLVRMEH